MSFDNEKNRRIIIHMLINFVIKNFVTQHYLQLLYSAM